MIPSKLVQIFIVSSVIFPILSVIIRYLQHDLIIDSKNSFDSFMFNSDAIFYSLVSKDIILNKGKLFDWIFAAAPEFFPTMLLTYVISLIIDNYFYSQIIFIVMQLLIFDYLMYKVTLIFTDRIFSLLTIVIINTLIIFFFNLEPFNYLFVASHHIGSFLGVLLTLFIYYSNQIWKKHKILIIYVLVFILTFSNPLFIGHLVIPLLAASIILDILNKKIGSKSIYLLLVVAFAAYSLKKIFFFHDKDCTQCMSTYSNVDELTLSYNIMITSLYHIKEFYITHSNIFQNIFVLIFVLLPLLFLIDLFILKKNKTLMDYKSLHFFLFILFSFGTTHLPFLLTAPNINWRYMNNVYLLPFMIVPIFLYPYLKDKSNRLLSTSALLFLLSFILSVSALDSEKKLNNLYYPEDILFIDKTLEKYDLNHGISSWWYANRLVYLSKRTVSMIPCHNIKPLHWDTKSSWLLKPPEFIINLDPQKIGYSYSKLIENEKIKIYIIS